MAFDWIHEESPVWDADKARIVGGAPQGALDVGPCQTGEPMAGEWWRVEDGDAGPVAYGWIDTAWGDAEMLLAVDPSAQGRGVGTFVLDQLEREAAARGLNYIYNVVRPTHPDAGRVTQWLLARGFEAGSEGVLRRRVRAAAR